MQVLTKSISTLSKVLRFIALTTMTFMMLFITVAVTSRLFFSPVIGDIELVQLGMVVLIMCGLAYTQEVGGHISIDLLADRFPIKIQQILEIIGSFLTFVVTLIIAYIYLGVAYDHMTVMKLSTNLVEVPYYPFDYIIFLGFLAWGLEGFLKFVQLIVEFKSPKNLESES